MFYFQQAIPIRLCPNQINFIGKLQLILLPMFKDSFFQTLIINLLMTNQIGRPEEQQLDKRYRKSRETNKNRLLKQGFIINKMWSNFNLSLQIIPESTVQLCFKQENLEKYFDELKKLWNCTIIRVSDKQLQFYTSKNDILYLLHMAAGPEKRFPIKKLYFLIFFFFYVIKCMNNESCAFLMANIKAFAKVARYGPENTSNNYTFIEQLAWWSLELSTLENINLLFQASDFE